MGITVLVIALAISSCMAFAESTYNTNKDDVEAFIKANEEKLVEAGCDLEYLKEYYSVEELQDIIVNNAIFLGKEEVHELYLVSKADPSKCLVAELSEKEYKQYKADEKSFVSSKLSLWSKGKSDTVMLDTLTGEASIMASDASETIDSGVLTTSLEAFDYSTSTHCKKKFAFNFHWESGKTPFNLLKDGVAIHHKGNFLGLTADYGYGGFVQTRASGSSSFSPSVSYDDKVTVGTHGMSCKFPLKKAAEIKGRFYLVIGGTKQQVKKGAEFTIQGQYAHSVANYDFDISVSSSGIAFTPKVSTYLKKSKQLSKIVNTY